MKDKLNEKLTGIVIEHSYNWSPDAEAKAAGDIRPGTVKLDFSDLTLADVIDHAIRHVTYRQIQPKLKKGLKLEDIVKVTALGTRKSMSEEQRDEKALDKMTPERLRRLLARAEEALETKNA